MEVEDSETPIVFIILSFPNTTILFAIQDGNQIWNYTVNLVPSDNYPKTFRSMIADFNRYMIYALFCGSQDQNAVLVALDAKSGAEKYATKSC